MSYSVLTSVLPEIAESSLLGRKRVRSPTTHDASQLGDDGML